MLEDKFASEHGLIRVIDESGDDYLLAKDIVRPGDRLVILMGSPIYQRAKTNLLRVHRVRE